MTYPQRHTVRRRAVVWCALLGLLSVVLVFAGYLVAQRALEADLDRRMEQRAALLRSAAETGGMPALTEAIHRYSRRSLRSFSYRLTDRSGTPLFGPRNGPAFLPGWHHLRVADLDDQAVEVGRVLTIRLPNQYLLSLIGDTDYIDAFDRIIPLVLGVSFALACIAALIGGLYLDRVVVTRLSAVNGTAADLAMLPDLSRRVPISSRHDEFDAVAATFNSMLDRIGALVTENRRVVGYVAHDLRAPLARLADKLADLRLMDGGRRTEALAVAEDDILDILTLFDAFLAIGRHDDGSSGLRGRMDLSARAADLAESFAVVAEASGRTLHASIEPGIAIRGDDALVSQIVVNLVENAIRHTPRHTRIVLSLAVVGDHARLVVSDNGREIGTDRGKVEREAVSSDRQRLGLKLIRSIAENHGGSFTNIPTGFGTTAQVMLPLA